jgi:pyruvate formate-lyase activating enzyme-like uncharacterized protein
MIISINQDTITALRNPKLSAYASIYLKIQEQFLEQVKQTGIELDTEDDRDRTKSLFTQLRRKGVLFRNDDKSLVLNHISPACEACRIGVGSATFFISLQCNRDCYFCFNPNQEHYNYYRHNQRDCLAELDQIGAQGHEVRFIALTGGEPLLHKDETVAFFRHAKGIFPRVHTRLYTSGDFIDEKTLQQLKDGLDEIRFSIRLHDRQEGMQSSLERIAKAKIFIPSVMVEMPILPDAYETMKDLLLELDWIGIAGINLLEFCFPFRNAKTFRNKGYKIRIPPYRVLYNYWYAGGLPIAGSEVTCLRLLEFALAQKLHMGIHYCSLENKHSGQIYQQNFGKKVSPRYLFSEKDFFFKSAKVFGEDIPQVLDRLNRLGTHDYFLDTQHEYLEFHVSHIPLLIGLDTEVGISSAVMETRQDGEYLRELKVDLTYPRQFDISSDV